MTQETPAPAGQPDIAALSSRDSIATLGDSRCPPNALVAAYAAIGLRTDGLPLDGRSEHYQVVKALLPQLVDATPAGLNGWNSGIDANRNGSVSNLEVMAALMAAAQVTVATGRSITNVSITEIGERMSIPLQRLRGQIPAR